MDIRKSVGHNDERVTGGWPVMAAGGMPDGY
jgi:hypothetical protein